MTTYATLRRLLRELDTMQDQARIGRESSTGKRGPTPITSRNVDGWYNFHAETTHGTFRR